MFFNFYVLLYLCAKYKGHFTLKKSLALRPLFRCWPLYVVQTLMISLIYEDGINFFFKMLLGRNLQLSYLVDPLCGKGIYFFILICRILLNIINLRQVIMRNFLPIGLTSTFCNLQCNSGSVIFVIFIMSTLGGWLVIQ